MKRNIPLNILNDREQILNLPKHIHTSIHLQKAFTNQKISAIMGNGILHFSLFIIGFPYSKVSLGGGKPGPGALRVHRKYL